MPETDMDDTVQLRILFATSLAPLNLSIPNSTALAIRNIKPQIRPYLTEETRRSALRLIHAGRVLEDAAFIRNALPITKRVDALENGNGSSSGVGESASDPKGKMKEQACAPLILHCAILSSTLSADALRVESILPTSNPDASDTATTTRSRRSSAVVAPAARGFDRLLSTQGFTAADVASLRAQHRSMVESRHTPEDMPTSAQLLDMEERWLDSANEGAAGSGLGSTGALQNDSFWGGAGFWRTSESSQDDEESTRQIHDMIYGAAMGFFWPVGAIAWGMREDGVWSRRRKEMVLLGLALNLVLGFMRVVPF